MSKRTMMGMVLLLVLLSGGLWGLFQAKKLWDRERLLLPALVEGVAAAAKDRLLACQPNLLL